MVIHGLCKLSFSDFSGKVGCTVFTAGCNFRCPFCDRASLVIDTYKNAEIPLEEFFDFLNRRQGILEGVCVTGGEPLIQHGIEEFLERIKGLGFAVKLDTNGSFPEKLRKVVESGLVDYVAMEIKNSQEHYGKAVGIEEYDVRNVHKSVMFLLRGNVPYEFRTTVVREFHQRSDFESIARWIQGAKKYYLHPFVDSGDMLRRGLHGYNRDIMEQALAIVKKGVPNAQIRDDRQNNREGSE